MRKHITEETMCLQLISIEVRNQSHDQILLKFPDARNFAVVVKKGHVEENLLRLTRRSYAKCAAAIVVSLRSKPLRLMRRS